MSAQRKISRRRTRARRLRGEGLSIREIAARLGVSGSTVHGDLDAGSEDLEPIPNLQRSEDGLPTPVAGATEGNQRAIKHGAQSELIETRARELVPQVYEANRHLDGRDGPAVSRYAATLARIERVYCWLSEQSDPVFADGGNAHLVYGRLERWERMASECERDLAISPRERAKLGLDLARGDSMVRRMQGGIG